MPPNLIRSSSVPIGTYSDSTFGPSIIKGVTQDVSKTMAAGINGNYGYPDFPSGKDVGQDFVLYGRDHQKANIPCKIKGVGAWGRDTYIGIMSCSASHGPPDAGPNWSPAAWGAEAFSKMKPTKPVGSVVNSAYELKDMPDLVKSLKDSVKSYKDLGNSYLEHQFGWLATLRDALKLVNLQRDTQKKLKQLLRDNGRPVRRRIVLFDTVTDPVITTGNAWGLMNPGLVTAFYSGTPTYVSRAFTTDAVWGSASFRYWLPPGPQDIAYKASLIRALHGFDLSPTTLYNAIPWSWLVDWFTNLGYVVSNLDAGVADRLAADWFYMMRKRVNVVQTDLRIPLYDLTGKPIVLTGTATHQSFSKVRLRGSPFGLGVSESSLSPMQLSILGALGLSKLG